MIENGEKSENLAAMIRSYKNQVLNERSSLFQFRKAPYFRSADKINKIKNEYRKLRGINNLQNSLKAKGIARYIQ